MATQFRLVRRSSAHSCVFSGIAQSAVTGRSRRSLLVRGQRWLLILALLFVVSGCDAAPSVLEPGGPAAGRVAALTWFLFATGTAVYIGVMAFLLVALFRRREQIPEATAAQHGRRIILFAGVVFPAVILLVVYGIAIGTLRALSTPAAAEELSIHVIGHRWWWEVLYPDYGFETANELHIPVGQPVRIVLSSEDVIHSFWVPELHGKLDLLPDKVHSFWLQADEPGIYRGECAEFCGIQHAKMAFVVVAEPVDSFKAWLAQQQQPAPVPADSLAQEGQEIFLSTTCARCHTVVGTAAAGDLGPDLTHLASRRTLGAGTLTNSLGNLGGWVSDPQHVKPGVLMPPASLTGEELQALLAYLSTLE